MHFLQVEKEDVTRRSGIRTTTAARTLLDLSETLTEERLERAIDDAIRKRVTDEAALRACLERNRTRGRSGVVRFERVLDERKGLLWVNGSDQEVQFLKLLIGAGLPAPAQQHWIVTANKRRYRADFVFVAERLVLEVDSFEYHRGNAAAHDEDVARKADLEAEGWMVLAVTPRQIHREPRRVLERVRRHLTMRRRSLSGAA